jgi:phage terminase large subunit-like protein
VTIVISTNSADPHHPMGELVEHAHKVNEGVDEDLGFVGHIYEVPIGADPFDESLWPLANPALGTFKSLEDMRARAVQARQIPSQQPAFKNLHLNMPIEMASRFLQPADWKKCLGDVDPDDLGGRECYAGLDLSERRDLTSLVLVFPNDADGFEVLSWFWLPKEGLLDREHVDRAPYSTWLQQEHLEITDGKSIHYGSVVRRLAEVSERFNILEVAYDRWNMERLSQAMSEIGLELPVRAFGQGYKDMSPAVDMLEAAVINERLRTSNPVLTMCALNAAVQTDPAGNRKLAKDRSTGRIDGAVALAMALRRATEYIDEDQGIRLPEGYSVTVL